MTEINNDKFISARAVLGQFEPPPSVRTIDRWIDDPRMNFPKPIYIGKRRFFLASEIAAFKARKASERRDN